MALSEASLSESTVFSKKGKSVEQGLIGPRIIIRVCN